MVLMRLNGTAGGDVDGLVALMAAEERARAAEAEVIFQ
jgi:hypothetical protein